MSAQTPVRGSAAAFFDVDGTLCDTTIVHYFRYFMLRRLPWLRGRLWYAGLLAKCGYYLLLDKRDRRRFNAVFYQNYAGLPAGEIKAQVQGCYEDVIAPRVFPEAQAAVAEHRRAGRAVVLVTGSLDFVVAPLAKALGASEVLASQLVEGGGRFTGCLAGPPMGPQEKSRLARAFAERHGIELAQCHAYGDSMADLPMLEIVGFPHAVNADRGLSAIARSRGWPAHHWVTTVAGSRA